MATGKKKGKGRPSDAAIKGHLSPSQSLGSFVFIFQPVRRLQAKLEELLAHAAVSQDPSWQPLSEAHELSCLPLAPHPS